MKGISIILCLLAAAASFAQDSQKLVGRWKVVAMYNASIYFDLQKDSLFLEKSKMENPLEFESDSVQLRTKSFLKEIFANSYYEFKNDGSFEENLDDTKGTYSVDEAAKVITVKRERKNKSTGELITGNENIPYSFKGNRLVFLSKGGDDGPNVEFEKKEKE